VHQGNELAISGNIQHLTRLPEWEIIRGVFVLILAFSLSPNIEIDARRGFSMRAMIMAFHSESSLKETRPGLLLMCLNILTVPAGQTFLRHSPRFLRTKAQGKPSLTTTDR